MHAKLNRYLGLKKLKRNNVYTLDSTMLQKLEKSFSEKDTYCCFTGTQPLGPAVKLH